MVEQKLILMFVTLVSVRCILSQMLNGRRICITFNSLRGSAFRYRQIRVGTIENMVHRTGLNFNIRLKKTGRHKKTFTEFIFSWNPATILNYLIAKNFFR